MADEHVSTDLDAANRQALFEELEELSQRARFEPHYTLDEVEQETREWLIELDSLSKLAGTSQR